MRSSRLINALVLTAGLVSLSHAATFPIPFSENFDAVAQGTYTTSNPIVGKFTVTGGSIDIVDPFAYAPNLTCFAPTSVNCVDMNGNAAGTIGTTLSFLVPGTYRLSFDLIGSQRQAVQANTTVQLGSFVPATTYTLNWNDRPSTRTFFFSVLTAQTANLTFSTTTNGATGLLLDNVVVAAADIPEPGTLSMLLLGAGLFVLALFRRKHA